MQLTELKPKFDAAGVGLVAISADTVEDSKEFVQEKKITVTLLSDPKLEAIGAFGVAMEGKDIAVPSTFIVSQDKVIHWKYIGENMTDRPDGIELLEKAKALKR